MTHRIATTGCPVPGAASGPVLFADVGMSFMGGVDPRSGEVIDTHHPLRGRSVAGTILAMPSGRGSCAGSLGIFELLLNGHAPRALVFSRNDTILTLGVVIAHEVFGCGIPILWVGDEDFATLANAGYALIDGAELTVADEPLAEIGPRAALAPLDLDGFTLTPRDRLMLAGGFGAAAAMALR
ncbi:MAG TPA: DUF126 domain-containing protein, partial [Ilumatobacteraceae bacterium]